MLDVIGCGVACTLLSMRQALETYKTELAKYNASASLNKSLVDKLELTVKVAQATALESQLVRSLRKAQTERKKSVQKYYSVYANVPETDVQPFFWAAAQKLLHS